jgi:hypothetical protein
VCPGSHTFYRDVDGDGFGNPSSPLPSCDGSQPAGAVDNNTDCNDANASIYPGAPETCDGLDHDCDGIAVGPPPEVPRIDHYGHGFTTLTWSSVSGATSYDLVASTISDLRANATSGATCLVNDDPDLAFDDNRPDPAAGEGYYYLVRANNNCGAGGYGFATSGVERVPIAACP